MDDYKILFAKRMEGLLLGEGIYDIAVYFVNDIFSRATQYLHIFTDTETKTVPNPFKREKILKYHGIWFSVDSVNRLILLYVYLLF